MSIERIQSTKSIQIMSAEGIHRVQSICRVKRVHFQTLQCNVFLHDYLVKTHDPLSLHG